MAFTGDPPESEPGEGAGDELDIHGTAGATLGGYFREHDRPPGFGGSDGHPYTVSIEVERVGDLEAPFRGYLVFPRWAETGLGVVGHVETPTLAMGTDRDRVQGELEDLPLHRVQELLEEAIERKRTDEEPPDAT